LSEINKRKSNWFGPKRVRLRFYQNIQYMNQLYRYLKSVPNRYKPKILSMINEMRHELIRKNKEDIRFRATLARANIINSVFTNEIHVAKFHSKSRSQVDIVIIININELSFPIR